MYQENIQYRQKVSAVNHRLKDFSKERNYTNHNNTINTGQLNGSKLHLNIKDTEVLISNFAVPISDILQ